MNVKFDIININMSYIYLFWATIVIYCCINILFKQKIINVIAKQYYNKIIYFINYVILTYIKLIYTIEEYEMKYFNSICVILYIINHTLSIILLLHIIKRIIKYISCLV